MSPPPGEQQRLSWMQRTFGGDSIPEATAPPIDPPEGPTDVPAEHSYRGAGILALVLAAAGIGGVYWFTDTPATNVTPPAAPAQQVAAGAAPSSHPTYKEPDFDWADMPEARSFKRQIVAGLNRLVRDNPRCASAEPFETAPMEGKFTKRHPIMWVHCKTPDGDSFGTTFNAKDAINPAANFGPAVIIDQTAATDACEGAAR